jgi:serine/threonine protein kinase
MKTIGRYEICGLLGRGGMSVVYKARLPRIGKMVALKLLKPHPLMAEHLGMAELRRRFLAEATTMARLRHPNLVEVWDFDEFEGTPFFVMEYFCSNLGLLIGETYRLDAPSRPLPLPRVIGYGKQILKGLSRLHHEDVVHRDLKPYNILLDEEDVAKISDFGLSKLRGEVWCGPSALMVGSPYYAAPEQERDPDSVDARSDLYALGVMLHRMLTGQLPEGQPTVENSFFTNRLPEPGRLDRADPLTVPGNANQGLPLASPASQLTRKLDRSWTAFLRKAIAPEPSDRFANAPSMAMALEEFNELWLELVRNTCAAPLASTPLSWPAPQSALPIRRHPLKVSPRNAQVLFELNPTWRPQRRGATDYAVGDHGIVTEATAGRIWQQSGSSYPLTWVEAHRYVNQLNRDRFAGISDWRLPTVPELLLLLDSTPAAGIACTPPVFDPTQGNLWSADRSSFTAAWYVNVNLGFVGWQDFTCRIHVRAIAMDGVALDNVPA